MKVSALQFLQRMVPRRTVAEPISFSRDEDKRFFTLQIVRVALAIVFTVILHQVLNISLPIEYLAFGAILGTLMAGRLLNRGYTFFFMFLIHAGVFIAIDAGLRLWNASSGSPLPASDFRVAMVGDTVFLVVLWYSTAFLSTWLFWCRDWAVTIEGGLSSCLLIWMLGGHRNYHLDAPKQVSSLSWKLAILQRLHVEPQHLFLILAAAATGMLAVYLVLSAKRPLFRGGRVERSIGKTRLISGSVIVVAAIFALTSYTYYVNKKYSQGLSRAMQGVGFEKQEGQSNLGFHSAMGATKQPAALVRLEGDYSKNPYAPLLYFREGALSSFSGREYVLAPPQYDTDVPRVRPGQPFVSFPLEESGEARENLISSLTLLLAERSPYALEPADNGYVISGPRLGVELLGLVPGDRVLQIAVSSSPIARQQVTQTVFMLMDHNTPFAVDYPTRIGTVKNPDPHRFTVAYQALSQAPTVPTKDLVGRPVGNPLWPREVLEHYLAAPGRRLPIPDVLPEDLETPQSKPVPNKYGEDLRYLAMSRRLTNGLTDPIEKAEAIIKYLSETSVYTRKPGHQIAENADPVAPYLFAEAKRGYCVHFAHAAVFLMRLAGIPSRIGTGYLTDLQYAKDGHILLSLADRHAWPEVYVDGYGWIVFDINPAKAENEQAPVPDEKLLEELMNKLDPVNEVGTPDAAKTPVEDESESPFSGALTPGLFGVILASLLVFFVALKLWLRFGYLLVFKPEERVIRSYSSFASQMFDLGLGRRPGETRFEHAQRLESHSQIRSAELNGLLQDMTYGKGARPPVENPEVIKEARKQFQTTLRQRVPLWKRFLSLFNPASISRIRRW